MKALAFSDDGARLAGAVTAGVGIWDARDGSLLAHVWPRSASALAFSSDGDILAVATERDAQVRVWDMPTLLEAPPDGRSLVLLEGTERTWMHDRAITCAAAHCLSPVLALAFVPGEHVIAAIDDGSASANVPLSYLFEVSTPANAGH